jgi:Ca2+-binding RTX toxin-like protein
MIAVHRRLLIGALTSALALALGLAPSAQAAAIGVCAGTTVTVTISPGAPATTSVTTNGANVTVNTNLPVVCAGLTNVVVNGDANPNVVTYDGNLAAGVSVTATLGDGDDQFTTVGNQTVTANGDNDVDTLVGGAGADTLNGGAGGDVLAGNGGGDALNGQGGADQLTGGAGNDTVDGGTEGDAIAEDGVGGDTVIGGTGAGTDTLTYFGVAGPIVVVLGGPGGTDTASQFEHVIGSSGADSLTGDVNDQTIDGGPGGDDLHGGGGNDVLDGDADVDTIFGDATPGDTLDGGTGVAIDILTYADVGTPVNVNLAGGGDDAASNFERVIGGSGDDVLTGDAGNQTIDGGPGGDQLRGGGGADVLDGETGADTIFGDDSPGDTLTGGGGAGTDILTYAGEAAAVIVVLGAPGGTDSASGFERVIGGDGADSLAGDTNGQQIDGGPGNDQIDGGGGADALNGDADADTIIGDGTPGDTLNGGTDAAIDTLTYAGVATPVNVKPVGGDDLASEFEHIIGGNAGDTLTGDSGNQTIDGGPGADQLDGGGGTDVLNGGTEADTIQGDASNGDTLDGGGGAGTDVLTYAGVASVVTVNLNGGGDDTTSGFEQVIGGNAGDTLIGDLNPNRLDGGPGNDHLFGNAGIDELNGEGDDDELTGGADADNVNGGAGADTIFEDVAPGDTLVGGTGGGIDVLTYAGAVTAVTVVLGGVGTDTASQFEHVIGGNAGDTLTGDVNDQVIDGGPGNDQLAGGGGNDTLNGQGDLDTIFGDGVPGDTLDGGTGADIDVLTYAGVATPVTVSVGGIGDDVATNFERIIGGDAGDTLTGDSNDQRIDGGTGADQINGGGGTDALNGDADGDTIQGDPSNGDTLDGGGGAGTDTLTYAGQATPVVVNLGGGGDDAATGFERVIGGNVGDTLTGDVNPQRIDGGPGDDHIFGLAGDDELNGDAGADELTGGADTDVASGGPDADTIFEDAGTGDTVTGGTDTATDTLSYAGAGTPVILRLGALGGTDLASEFERVIGGNAGDDLRGDSNANRLDGGPGTDTLDGGGGIDELNGDADADTIIGDDVPGDTLTGGPGAATDILTYAAVATPVNVNLGGGPDDAASGFEWVIGGSAGDTITGDAGDNRLDGGPGNDTLAGAAGADTINGDAGSDTASYAERNTGVTVSLVAPGEDTLNSIENLTGGGGDDDLTGDGNPNVIRGANGSDTIHGGADPGDTLIGGTDGGHDVVTYAGTATPVVINFGGPGPVATDAASEFEEGVGGNAADALIGDAAANTLRGGPGNDTLNGGAGADTIDGGADSDVVFGGADPGDALDGGAGSGRDLLTYDGEATNIVVDLTTPAPFLAPTDAASNFEDVAGGSGDDTIAGDDAANTLSGGPGTDTVTYASRAAGVDVSLDGLANDGAGSGGEGDNVISENVIGGGGGDRLAGSQGVNDLRGLGGDDTVIGRGGSDVLDGGDGTDTVSYEDRGPGEGVSVSLEGAGGGTGELDTLTQFERLQGGGGDDNLTGSGAADEIRGGAGADVVAGAGGNDTLAGEDGPDTLSGGAGSDALAGGAGNDRLDGGTEPDGFDGGPGDDDINAFDGTGENIVCGDGYDRVDHDLTDSFSLADCESRVVLGYVPPPFAIDPRQRDRDRDGSFAGTDCNDLDPSIRPGGPDIPGDGIDQNCNGSDAPFPPITTEFKLNFEKAKTGTRVKVFELRRVPAGSRVVLTCKSAKFPKCVFASRSTTVKSKRDKFSVRGYFGDRPLSNGSTIEARVSSGTSIGRSIKIAIRKPGQNPKLTRACLAIDGKTAAPCV